MTAKMEFGHRDPAVRSSVPWLKAQMPASCWAAIPMSWIIRIPQLIHPQRCHERQTKEWDTEAAMKAISVVGISPHFTSRLGRYADCAFTITYGCNGKVRITLCSTYAIIFASQ
jgi:hypothetical protein